MKKQIKKHLMLLPLLLGLTGCVEGLTVDKKVAPKYQSTNATTATGHNSEIEWQCKQLPSEKDVLLVNCQFNNFNSAFNVEKEACIRLYYYRTNSNAEAGHSRLVCSGPIGVGQNVNTHVAFTKHQRVELSVLCGEKSEECKLVIKEEPKK